MSSPISKLIEEYLLEQKTWVKSTTLCEMFGVAERDLRVTGTKLGLCSEFAISSNLGYRHIRCSPPEEVYAFFWRIADHASSELDRISRLRRAYEKR